MIDYGEILNELSARRDAMAGELKKIDDAIASIRRLSGHKNTPKPRGKSGGYPPGSIVKGSVLDRVVQLLRTSSPMRWRDIAPKIGVTDKSVTMAMIRGVKTGVIVRVSRGIYALAENSEVSNG